MESVALWHFATLQLWFPQMLWVCCLSQCTWIIWASIGSEQHSHPGKSELPMTSAGKEDMGWGKVPWWYVGAVFWGIRRGSLKRVDLENPEHRFPQFVLPPPHQCLIIIKQCICLGSCLQSGWKRIGRPGGYIQTLLTGAGSHPCLWDCPQDSLLQADLSPDP